MYAKGSFSGEYAPIGNPNEAQAVSVHEFSVGLNGPGKVNRLIVRRALEYQELPVIMGERLVDYAQQLDYTFEPAAVIEGGASTTMGKNVGTIGELTVVKAFMDQRGLERPLLIGQAYHIGRAALQARKVGLSPIVPADLPENFDENSTQWWTRGTKLWALHEAVGVPVLRLQGKL